MKQETNENKINYDSELNLVHFKKVNLFGLSKVGKKTLINYIQHYSDKDINFEIKKEDIEKEDNDINKTNKSNSNLVEEITKLSIVYYDTRHLDINLYVTNIDNLELIKNNLDTLLSNSECAIFMVDITKTETFTWISSVNVLSVLHILQRTFLLPSGTEFLLFRGRNVSKHCNELHP